MSTIAELRAQLQHAETVQAACCIRATEAMRALTRAQVDQYEVASVVARLRAELRERDERGAQLWREHMAAPATPLCRLCGQRIHAGGVRCSATCPADERFGRGGARP
jgi:hypothetical protein